MLRAFGGNGRGGRCKDMVEAERAAKLGKKGKKKRGKNKVGGGVGVVVGRWAGRQSWARR